MLSGWAQPWSLWLSVVFIQMPPPVPPGPGLALKSFSDGTAGSLKTEHPHCYLLLDPIPSLPQEPWELPKKQMNLVS